MAPLHRRDSVRAEDASRASNAGNNAQNSASNNTNSNAFLTEAAKSKEKAWPFGVRWGFRAVRLGPPGRITRSQRVKCRVVHQIFQKVCGVIDGHRPLVAEPLGIRIAEEFQLHWFQEQMAQTHKPIQTPNYSGLGSILYPTEANEGPPSMRISTH